MDKNDVLEDCISLYNEIDDTIRNLVKARMTGDKESEAKSASMMEYLLTESFRNLNVVIRYLEDN